MWLYFSKVFNLSEKRPDVSETRELFAWDFVSLSSNHKEIRPYKLILYLLHELPENKSVGFISKCCISIKKGSKQCDYNHVLKHYLLYCKGFLEDSDNRVRNWGSGLKDEMLLRL